MENKFFDNQMTTSAEESFDIAMEHYLGKNGKEIDYPKAFQCFLQAAEAGHAVAQYHLAHMFFKGSEVKVQFNQEGQEGQFVFWLTKSAQNGFKDAQFDLGQCYFNGNCVRQDKKVAVRWLKKAAEQRHRLAQLLLASCFEQGDGVKRDYKKAYAWFKKASVVLDPAQKRYEFSFLERIKKLGVCEREIEKIKNQK